MPSNLTPEFSKGGRKAFPARSSLSGYSPEWTKGGGKAFPNAQSQLAEGTAQVTPERNQGGAFFPSESQVNT